MPAKGKSRSRTPAASEVVLDIHQKLVQEDAANQDLMVRRFEMALQNRFRGPEQDVRRKLSIHLAAISRFNPPALPWIDLGCGRGEWLDLVSGAGAHVTGIDRNQFAIELCRNRGLPVVESDAVQHLRTLGDGSCAVLTAFHVLENCEFPYILASLREAARVLAAGGLFVLETPNPENPRVAGVQFWLDPMHLRPLPRELMEFTCEHFGLRVAHGEGLNLEQHGPADYTLVAIR
jgi:O-antigen chain-terminating methyltransferase